MKHTKIERGMLGLWIWNISVYCLRKEMSVTCTDLLEKDVVA